MLFNFLAKRTGPGIHFNPPLGLPPEDWFGLLFRVYVIGLVECVSIIATLLRSKYLRNTAKRKPQVESSRFAERKYFGI